MIEIFQKPEISLFTLPFSTDMGLDFCIFLTKCKKSNESNIYIYHVRDWQRDDQTDEKQTFYQTITLQAGPINQVDDDCF